MAAADVLLRDPQTNAPLFEYLREQDDENERRERERRAAEEREKAAKEAERIAREQEQARREAEEQARLVTEENARRRHREEEERLARQALLGKEEEELRLRRAKEQQDALERSRQEEHRKRQEAAPSPPAATRVHKAPSPTINTKAAMAEVNAMFAKTMRFDGDDDQSTSGAEESDDDGFDNATPLPPSQAETDDTFWSHSQSQHSQQPLPPSQQTLSSQVDSESGETTEESESEDEFGRPSSHLHPAQQQHGLLSLSRCSSASSSTSSSSGFSFDRSQPPTSQPAFKPTRPAAASFMPKRQEPGSVTDENASSSAASSRPPLRPSSALRTPLTAKPTIVASQPSSSKPAFEVFEETGEQPAKQAVSAKPQRISIFSDETAEQQANEVLDSAGEEDEPHMQAPGYAMGRRVAGSSRFADMMDVMTPITERTCEFGMATATMTQHEGGEIKATIPYIHETDEEDFEQKDDLASSRGSAWGEGRRQLSQVVEEEELSGRQDPSWHSEGV